MRSVLIGAVDSTRVALEALSASKAAPSLVISLPPDQGRRRHSDYVDLEDLCARLAVRLARVSDVNHPDSLKLLIDTHPEYVFVIGWSQICRRPLLKIPKIGIIGYHPAPLPTNRGRAVIPWTILQGATETGSTLFWLDEGMDSGPILNQRRFPLEPRETAQTLYAKHLDALKIILGEAVALLRSAQAPALEQAEEHATYCAKRTPADGHIDWQQKAADIDRLVRATTRPYPGAFTFADHEKLIVWQADVHDGPRYSALPGQILYFDQSMPVVRCGDGMNLILLDFDLGKDKGGSSRLTTHQRLGFPPRWVRP
jgi:methionyl-tRNA formyltransferase